MNIAETFYHALVLHARLRGHKSAVIEVKDGQESARISYAALQARVNQFAGRMLVRNVHRGTALILMPAGIDAIVAILGCLAAGVVPSLRAVPPGAAPEWITAHMKAVLRSLPNVAVVIAAPEFLADHDESQLSPATLMSVTASCGEPDVSPIEEDACQAAELIQFTSGTTSAPKAVRLSTAGLQKSVHNCQEVWGYSQDSITVTWAPHSHIFGLVTGILLPLYTGATTVVMPPSEVGSNPLSWLETISRYRATHSGGPDFAFQSCCSARTDASRSFDLRSWRCAISGGELVREKTMHQFAETFSADGFRIEAFCPSYGMSENSGLVSSIRIDEPPSAIVLMQDTLSHTACSAAFSHVPESAVSVGRACPDSIIRICDPCTLAVLPDKTPGEILVHSETLCLGPAVEDGPQDRFCTLPGADGLPARFLRTGDFGFMSHGSLYLVGRLKELIVIKGRKFTPHEIERCAKDVHGDLGDAAAFSIDLESRERVVLFQEMRLPPERAIEEQLACRIHSAVKTKLRLSLHEVVFIERGSMPRNGSGKIQRVECKRRYLEQRGMTGS